MLIQQGECYAVGYVKNFYIARVLDVSVYRLGAFEVSA
jgi:hypothetical protein